MWLWLLLAGVTIYINHRSTSTVGDPGYVIGAVEKGTLTVTVSGSGQVSASNQIDIKPQVSGMILTLPIHNGQEISSNTLLAQLDSKDAYRSVRDANLNLQSAQLSLQKLTQAADNLTVSQAENSLASAQDSLAKLTLSQQIDYDKAVQQAKTAKDALQKGYEDEFSAVSDSYLNLPSIMTGLYDMVNGTGIGESEPIIVGRGQLNSAALLNSLTLETDRSKLQIYINNAIADYNTARVKYDANFDSYKRATRYSDSATIEALSAQTLDTVKAVTQAAKSESNVLDAWVDFQTQQNKSIFAKVRTYQTQVATFVSQTNSALSSVYSSQQSLQNNRDAQLAAENSIKQMDQNNPLELKAAQATVKEREASLAKIQSGADKLDLQSQQLTVRQRQSALYDASQELAKYAVRSPITGVVAKVSAKVGDQAGSATAIATVTTKQKIADISLNEVDAAKVKVGQKVILTFDAVDGLSISGQVADVDSIGTVTQGVVSYNVKITFDTQDDRVKSGMSVSTEIITAVAQDVLMVPSGAVKTQGNNSYVEMFDGQKVTVGQTFISAVAPTAYPVEVGLSNDTMVEIKSGIKEGDLVVTRTVAPTAAKAAASTAPSLFPTGGNRAAGGGAIRFQGR